MLSYTSNDIQREYNRHYSMQQALEVMQRHARDVSKAFDRGVQLDPRWLRTARHFLVAAIAGVAVTEDPGMLDLTQYLREQGVSRGQLRKHRSAFGQVVREIYTYYRGHLPLKSIRRVGSVKRYLNSYFEEDRPLLDRAWAIYIPLINPHRGQQN